MAHSRWPSGGFGQEAAKGVQGDAQGDILLELPREGRELSANKTTRTDGSAESSRGK
ncbi:hypothetical protein SAVCW2_61120 [Streptomyces avermitilis]|uniref:Uncharacterized protein n=1 Tax=Streptomyces avermitilis TaxID=33903 RepID=A0A499V8E8_STRAX|nr:hypothetical protein SAVMC3_24610 [Streptomyces avermitilis]GDY86913.1 hypothetical protein SAVCW2_61120 [Streptomyces avermitilis]